MSLIKSNSIQVGLNNVASKNMIIDASDADGLFRFKTGSGTELMTLSTAAISINESGKVYGQNNILGEVSEMFTIPSGALIEKGTNSYGSFIRFADGTLINIITNETTGSDGTKNYQFPSEFIDTNYFVHGIVESSGTAVMIAKIATLYNSSATLLWIINAGTSSAYLSFSVPCRIFAIGRWF